LSAYLGKYLHEYPWEWWATVTFRDDPVDYGAWRRIREFLTWLERKQGRPVGAFIALELHRYRGNGDPASLVPHFHLLVLNVAGVSRKAAWRYLYTRCGRSRIEPYNPDRGASYYISKYIGKECLGRGDWDIWRPEVIKNAGKPLWTAI